MILFDTRWISNNGIGRFAAELKNRIQFDVYYNSFLPSSPLDPIRLSIDKKVGSAKLFFSPGYNAPLFSKVPYVLTIHDINHIDRDENSSVLKKIYYRTILSKLVRNAELVFTVSNFSKERIIDYFHKDSNKVIVVGNGVSDEFSPDGKKFNLGTPYILCVSNRKKHKNEDGLLKAFSMANIPYNVKLIFTGEETIELKKLITRLNLLDRVIFIGKVSNEILADLYRGAFISIFPSFYEGFGLPIVESFSCGTPIITSNITSMAEVAEDGALLVDPNDVDNISEAIEKLFNDNILYRVLSEKGLEIAQKYTWENTIDKIRSNILSLGYNMELRKNEESINS
ncbi:glycosyltransferase family 4 protein [Gallibacterium anatis]|uniref:Glycosyl transferase family 1 n=1 Tax=Gallibacterium anatis 12656/12 TaxID=1195244 RepID=U1H2E4_9PAST|nr:glycosyltransferase family 1 protein [Gallibacterium anatis]ERF78948.1 hypothetical protein N561_03450 [Gallibacterium anatis 12656/12]KGQ47646.1 hypothetical protein JL04_09670 [Gallibacterium anatis]KGQ65397.1 hypothetical protein IO43_02510 [Gallibacterium anatis 7990]